VSLALGDPGFLHVLRTSEATPYANVILFAGVIFSPGREAAP
jgi:D-ribose pyranose/furanose isomerase RbsD